MEERRPKNAVLQTVKTVLIVLAVFAASILYIFVTSAAEGRNYKGKTSDMYGRDSLEYVGEPVMKISVWQENEKTESSKYLKSSAYFYDLVPLTLKKGEKVSTEKDIFDDNPRWGYIETGEARADIVKESLVNTTTIARFTKAIKYIDTASGVTFEVDGSAFNKDLDVTNSDLFEVKNLLTGATAQVGIDDFLDNIDSGDYAIVEDVPTYPFGSSERVQKSILEKTAINANDPNLDVYADFAWDNNYIEK